MRQLSLFKSRRQRGIAPPPPLEFQMHATLADILRRWANPHWKWTHLPMGELRDKITAARLQRMGVQAGWFDFVFIGPKQQVFWLELKRFRMGRLSEAQAEMAAHLKACGFPFLITNSLDDAVATLKQAGILPSKVELQ